MIETSKTKYVTLRNGDICIPTGRTHEDTAEVFCFMRRSPDRKVWIKRSDIFISEHVEQLSLI